MLFHFGRLAPTNTMSSASSSLEKPPVVEEQFVSEAKRDDSEEIGEWDKPGAGCRPCW